MTYRIVTRVVVLLVALLVATAIGFAGALDMRVPGSRTPAAAVIPHPVTGDMADCERCHEISDDSYPVTHRYYEEASCQSCHPWRPVTLVPHSVAMGDERCVLCHGNPSHDLGMPRNHLDFEEQRCSICHAADERRAARNPRNAGDLRRSIPPITHPVEGAFERCLNCHRIGSDPSMPDGHEAYAEATCAWCHEPAEDATDAAESVAEETPNAAAVTRRPALSP